MYIAFFCVSSLEWKKHTAVDNDPQSNRESVLDEEDEDDA